jgi:hypothetical protein
VIVTNVRAGLDLESPQFTPESIGDFARRELLDRPLIELDECDGSTFAQAARRRSP